MQYRPISIGILITLGIPTKPVNCREFSYNFQIINIYKKSLAIDEYEFMASQHNISAQILLSRHD